MIRVTHVINGLGTGGAEVALLRLLQAVDPGRFAMEVVALAPEMGPVADSLARLGWPVSSLDMTPRRLPRAAVALERMLRRNPPDVVQTWMYHAGLVGGACARLARVPAVVWNLRQGDLEAGVNKRSTLLAARASHRLARWLPDRIVCGSHAAERLHRGLGYPAEKLVVIPNGFDLPRLAGEERESLRRELGIDLGAILIGRVARVHPYKDHRTFLAAAAIVRRRLPDARFVLCGAGADWSNPSLVAWVREFGLEERVHLLGERPDVPRIHAALDVACSSSLGEGFPNVVGEAMAAGVPVVATDAGDSAYLVGATGRIVPPGDPDALAAALVEVAGSPPEERRRLGTAARLRIETEFSLERMASAYCGLYEELSATGRPSPAR